MVVAVGLTLVEPVAEVEVKVPGVIVMDVAPDAAQVSMLPAPEAMLAGLAPNEVIAGTLCFPVVLEELTEPQPASARETPIETTNA